MTSLVLAIDPGGTTGMALRIDESKYATFTCSEPSEVYQFIKTNQQLLKAVIIETFQAQIITKYGLHTVRIVGGVEALCYIFEIEYIKHMPQERSAFQEDAEEILKETNHVVHEEDALAHLLRYEYDIRKKQNAK